MLALVREVVKLYAYEFANARNMSGRTQNKLNSGY